MKIEMLSKKIILVAALLFANPIQCVAAITCQLDGHKFEEGLAAYCHTRWVAYKNNTSFFYQPFTFSEQLSIHKRFEPVSASNFKNIIKIENSSALSALKISELHETLCVLHYPDGEKNRDLFNALNEVNWSDEKFLAQLRQEIKPSKPIETLKTPQNRIKLAIHMHLAEGSTDAPLIYPPMQFYIDQIRMISDLYNDQLIYIYIFTHDSNPQKIASYLKEHLKKPNITIDHPKKGKHNSRHEMENFFSMLQFDFLIRPASSISLIAAKLARYKICISPSQYKIDGKKVLITQTETIVNGEYL